MSRSGYVEADSFDDNGDMLAFYRYRGQVASAIRGKRGQGFLRDLLTALDALSEKRLIADDLETPDGDVCAIGALGRMRGVDMSKLDPEEYEQVAAAFGVAEQLAREVVFLNDEDYKYATPEHRWELMRAWVVKKLGLIQMANPRIRWNHDDMGRAL